MSGMIVLWTCTIMVVLAFSSAARAEPQRRHILDAAINLDRATEHVARYCNSPEFWLNIQRRTDLWQAPHDPKERERIERARLLDVASGCSSSLAQG